jgi:hypothetical protein
MKSHFQFLLRRNFLVKHSFQDCCWWVACVCSVVVVDKQKQTTNTKQNRVDVDKLRLWHVSSVLLLVLCQP